MLKTSILSFRCLVLDEADRLLEMGYEKDVAAIVKSIEDHKKAATYDPMALMRQTVNKKFDTEEDSPQEEPKSDEKVLSKHPLTDVFISKERQTILLSATLTKVRILTSVILACSISCMKHALYCFHSKY